MSLAMFSLPARFVCLSLLLWRGLYKDLEMIVMVMVASFSLIIVVAVSMLQGTNYAITASDIASGFRFAMPAEGAFLALGACPSNERLAHGLRCG